MLTKKPHTSMPVPILGCSANKLQYQNYLDEKVGLDSVVEREHKKEN